ncbi:MAG: hypothetical protein GWP91_21840 [Rhodobacterales bacterium]|nr:hypothetical protein [Rhodobacterales bacterium]
MQTAIMLVLLLSGLSLAAFGLYLRQQNRTGQPPEIRPARVSRTDPHGQHRIIERTVFLALELARVDGSIAEEEILAIEEGLSGGVVSMAPDEAERMVHNVLRTTIRQAQLPEVLAEIAHHADTEHRDWVVRLLDSVAASDGRVNPDESAFMSHVYAELGHAK